MRQPELDDAIALVAKALTLHFWPACPPGDSALGPVLALFELLHQQRELGPVSKESILAAGIEFNRMILDAQGKRHNASVEEANECFRAGRALVGVLASLDPKAAGAAERRTLEALGRARHVLAPLEPEAAEAAERRPLEGLSRARPAADELQRKAGS